MANRQNTIANGKPLIRSLFNMNKITTSFIFWKNLVKWNFLQWQATTVKTSHFNVFKFQIIVALYWSAKPKKNPKLCLRIQNAIIHAKIWIFYQEKDLRGACGILIFCKILVKFVRIDPEKDFVHANVHRNSPFADNRTFSSQKKWETNSVDLWPLASTKFWGIFNPIFG